MGVNHPISGRKARAVISRQGEFIQAYGDALEAQTKRLRVVEGTAVRALIATEWFADLGMFERLWIVLRGKPSRRALALLRLRHQQVTEQAQWQAQANRHKADAARPYGLSDVTEKQ